MKGAMPASLQKGGRGLEQVVVCLVVLFPYHPSQPATREEPSADLEGFLTVPGDDRSCVDAVGEVNDEVVNRGHGSEGDTQVVATPRLLSSRLIPHDLPVVTGRLTIPTADGDLLHYSAVASEPLESASKAPAAEVAASSCLRRAAALARLGLELWG